MKKLRIILLALVVLTCALPAAADDVVSFLTAEVVLAGMERLGNDYLLTLELPDGDKLVVYAVERCRYQDGNNRAVSPEDFLKNYKGRKISVDFLEVESSLPEYEHIVYECRAAR